MTRWVRLALVALFLAAITGCGQKGPLYLPDNSEDEEITTSQSGS